MVEKFVLALEMPDISVNALLLLQVCKNCKLACYAADALDVAQWNMQQLKRMGLIHLD